MIARAEPTPATLMRVIRGRALPVQAVVASATGIAARPLRMEGFARVVMPGASAGLFIVDGVS